MPVCRFGARIRCEGCLVCLMLLAMLHVCVLPTHWSHGRYTVVLLLGLFIYAAVMQVKSGLLA